MPNALPTPAFDDPKHHLRLYQGDCLDVLAAIPASSVDLVFADPPYFLSNGGITCHAGKMVSVHKGDWDKLPGPDLGPVASQRGCARGQRRYLLWYWNCIGVVSVFRSGLEAHKEISCAAGRDYA